MYYVLVDQMLLREGKTDTDGVIAFAGYVHATDKFSPIASGAPWGRPEDYLGLDDHRIEMSGDFTRFQEIAEVTGMPLSNT